MSVKLLTIIVPTFNMERYLDRCLSSLVLYDSQMAKLEVLVIIDGATDGSLQLAQQYSAKQPDTFRVIEKENGNYGSCINRGLQEANGKYIKILDADDWFDTKVLRCFINDITKLTEDHQQPDVIHTPFTRHCTDGAKEVIHYNTMNLAPYEYGRIYPLDDILDDGYIRFFLIHGLTYRTELLRDMKYEQTVDISYTDTQWTCYPFYKAGNIVFLNLNLYQYDSTREGQTTNPEVLIKHLDQLQKVTDIMLEYHELHNGDACMSDTRRTWMKQYHANRIRVLYKHYLLDMPRRDFDCQTMETMDRHYMEVCRRNDFNISLYPENKLLRLDYIKYWHKHHHRWPVWLESSNRLLDKAMKFLYIRIIRR